MGAVYRAHGETEKCVQYLVEKPEAKKQHGRPSRRWDDNTEVYLREQ
jgi:hypothetical protein